MATARKPAAKKVPPLAVLSKEALLAAEDLEQMEVEVPEWGGKVILRQISRQEQVDAEKAATVGDEMDINLLHLHTLAAALVEPKFTHDEIGSLGEKNATVVGKIVARQLVLQQGGKESLADFEKSLLD